MYCNKNVCSCRICLKPKMGGGWSLTEPYEGVHTDILHISAIAHISGIVHILAIVYISAIVYQTICKHIVHIGFCILYPNFKVGLY